MTSVRGLLYMLRTIKFSSLYNAVRTYLDDKPRTIEFKWHFKERLKWEQIRTARNYALHGWKAIGVGSDERFGDYMIFEKRGFKLAVPLQKLRFFEVYRLESLYEPLIEYVDKKIVDVGGFIGETMILFKMWGAEVVEVYEPDPINCEIIKLNMALNNIVNTKLSRKAVWKKREKVEIGFPSADDLHCQGLTIFADNTSSYRFCVEAVPVEDILDSEVDIIKFDCEGCEHSLLELDRESIRKIPVYIIEIDDIGPYKKDQLLRKIEECGFKVDIITSKGRSLKRYLIKAIRL